MSYIIPFQKKPITIVQGFHGKCSHKNYVKSKNDMSYSVDFLLLEGTEIIASREGTVVLVRDDGKKNYSGDDPAMEDKAYMEWMNVIEIMHADGTIASYCHLKYRGALVKVGDKVRQGQVIGLSGNTGWSLAPHLDFCVYRMRFNGYNIKTIKIKFKDYKGPLEDCKIKSEFKF